MGFKKALHEVIENDLISLRDDSYEPEERKKLTDSVTQLVSKAIELEKLRQNASETKHECEFKRFEQELKVREFEFKARQSELEQEFKNKEFEFKIRQAELEKEIESVRRVKEERERSIQTYINVALNVLPSIITVWGVAKSFEFEKTGTITTLVGRGFINKLIPKK